MVDTATHQTLRRIFKDESVRLVAALTRMLQEISLAEELVQDALLVALEQWPQTGVPENPGAWLMTAAKNRAINVLNRSKMLQRTHSEIGHSTDSLLQPPDTEETLVAALDDTLGDDVLRLIFTACHPILSTEAQVALTLRLVGGLTTEEIARAYLQPESTVAQRIVRAKRTLAENHVSFVIPEKEQLSERVFSVLHVIYLIFNEGYCATAGDDLIRPSLCDEALRLGGILVQLAPQEIEILGLQAMMLLTHSRFLARIDSQGDPVLLLEQDRTRWDQSLITQGLLLLEQINSLGGASGPYSLQAEIAACHSRAKTADDTDWGQIALLYGSLLTLTNSPVVALNHAIATSMSQGPAEGLRRLDALEANALLKAYHLLPSARAEMLEKLGQFAQAKEEFERAANLAQHSKQRSRLMVRANLCAAKIDLLTSP